MKEIKFNRIFQILYPLIVYYLIYNAAFEVFNRIYGNEKGKLFCLLLAGIIALVPEIIIFSKIPKIEYPKYDSIKVFIRDIIYIIIIVLIGILLNVLVTKFGLIPSTKGYEKASSTLSDGVLLTKIFCNVIIIPILEELLYRGIICGQLYLFKGTVVATIISSFCFGILHFNIVQFLYAFIVGLALGYVYCKSKKLWVVITAHGITNLIVILFA